MWVTVVGYVAVAVIWFVIFAGIADGLVAPETRRRSSRLALLSPIWPIGVVALLVLWGFAFASYLKDIVDYAFDRY